MFSSHNAKESLKSVNWVEGKIFPVAQGPYRYQIVVHCSSVGRQKAEFANGEYSYFCYVELCAGNGSWIEKGTGIVPVLPDGRLLMVIEQRPAQGRYTNRSTLAQIGGKKVDLAKFGPYSSLEFPGGALDPNEGLKMGALRELVEETEIESQEATLYRCLRPVYLFGSDIAIQHYSSFVYLSGLNYQERTEGDGGLNVVALTKKEVMENIHNGVIASGQAALAPWNFYLEVSRGFFPASDLIKFGYINIEKIKIAKPAK